MTTIPEKSKKRFLLEVFTPYPSHSSGAEGYMTAVYAHTPFAAAHGAILDEVKARPMGPCQIKVHVAGEGNAPTAERYVGTVRGGAVADLRLEEDVPQPTSTPLAELLAVARGAFADGTTDDLDVGTAERTVALRESMAASALVLAEVGAKFLAMMESNHV